MTDDRTTDERAGDRPKRAAEDCRHPVLGYLGRNAGVHCVDCGTIWKRTRVPGGINGQGRLVALRVPVPPAVEGAADCQSPDYCDGRGAMASGLTAYDQVALCPACQPAAVTPGAHAFVASRHQVDTRDAWVSSPTRANTVRCAKVESAAVHQWKEEGTP